MKSLVIIPNDKTRDVGTLLAIARAEAKKKEGKTVTIRALQFIPELDVYVAVYESCV